MWLFVFIALKILKQMLKMYLISVNLSLPNPEASCAYQNWYFVQVWQIYVCHQLQCG
jgi:hypothetical protein